MQRRAAPRRFAPARPRACAAGFTRDLPDDLTPVGYQGKRDRWGNACRYTNLTTAQGNGTARKNKNLSPINTDFDLWSMGADGESHP